MENSKDIDANEIKFQLRGILMKWFNEGKNSHGKMAIAEYPSSMINRDADNFITQFQSEQKPLTDAEIEALAEKKYPFSPLNTWNDNFQKDKRSAFIKGYKAALKLP